MHTLTIRIEDRVIDKVVYFLKNLPRQDVEIMSDEVMRNHKESEDFISYLAANPREVAKEFSFLSREEIHER